MKYRKRPVVVEAMRFQGWNVGAIWVWARVVFALSRDRTGVLDGLYIQTLEGNMKAQIGDWIIRGVRGELYLCKPDVFDLTYEAVSTTQAVDSVRQPPKEQVSPPPMIKVLREALAKIKSEQGRVCPEFETCKHAACKSSYDSWVIADRALRANN